MAWQHYLTGSDKLWNDITKRVLSNTENDPTKGIVKSALQDWSIEALTSQDFSLPIQHLSSNPISYA